MPKIEKCIKYANEHDTAIAFKEQNSDNLITFLIEAHHKNETECNKRVERMRDFVRKEFHRVPTELVLFKAQQYQKKEQNVN